MKEVPIQSEFQINLMFDEVEKLAKPLEAFCMLVDLTEAQRPSAQTREYLRKRLTQMNGLLFVGLFTGKNRLLNMAAQFVFGTTNFRSFSVHTTQEEALLAIQAASCTEDPRRAND